MPVAGSGFALAGFSANYTARPVPVAIAARDWVQM